MTGSPLDLTPFGSIVSGVGWIYWLLFAAALWWVLRGRRSWKGRLVWALPVVLIFGFLPGRAAWHGYLAKQRFEAATAHFEMRCKSAGEKITRTVDNVDGVVWMKWRDKDLNESKQFKLDDPYGQDCTAADCIEQLLRITKGIELDPKKEQRRLFGYQFVESKNPSDGLTYRYTLNLYRPHDRDPKWLETHVRPELLAQPIERLSARYGVTWDDISMQEDREMWIAGGSLKVIDLQANEVIAERIGFMMDRGLGDKFNGRSPWRHARRTLCPASAQERVYPNTETLIFLAKVLRPTNAN